VTDKGLHLLRERPRVALWNHVFPAWIEVPLQRFCIVPSVRGGQAPEQNKNEHQSTNNQLQLELQLCRQQRRRGPSLLYCYCIIHKTLMWRFNSRYWGRQAAVVARPALFRRTTATRKYHYRRHQKRQFRTDHSQTTIYQQTNVAQSIQKTALVIVGGKNL
jgi:hypothetical protein